MSAFGGAGSTGQCNTVPDSLFVSRKPRVNLLNDPISDIDLGVFT